MSIDASEPLARTSVLSPVDTRGILGVDALSFAKLMLLGGRVRSRLYPSVR